MHVKGDLLDFAVFLEGCFLAISLLLFEGNGLGFSPKVVDIFLAWVYPRSMFRGSCWPPWMVMTPAGAGIFMHKYN